MDGITAEHFLSLFNGGRGRDQIKKQLIKEYSTFLQKFFTGDFSEGQIHDTIKGWLFNQIKMKMELDDPQVHNGKIQSTMRYWITDLLAVINKSASRAILAATTMLVDKVNSTPPMAPSSDQCDETLKANHESAQHFIEEMDLLVLNQNHTQI